MDFARGYNTPTAGNPAKQNKMQTQLLNKVVAELLQQIEVLDSLFEKAAGFQDYCVLASPRGGFYNEQMAEYVGIFDCTIKPRSHFAGLPPNSHGELPTLLPYHGAVLAVIATKQAVLAIALAVAGQK